MQGLGLYLLSACTQLHRPHICVNHISHANPLMCPVDHASMLQNGSMQSHLMANHFQMVCQRCCTCSAWSACCSGDA